MKSTHSSGLVLLAVLGLACFSGCANGLTGGRSMFSSAPGTNGPRSDEEIEAMAAKDSWQPGSPFTVTSGPNVTVH